MRLCVKGCRFHNHCEGLQSITCWWRIWTLQASAAQNLILISSKTIWSSYLCSCLQSLLHNIHWVIVHVWGRNYWWLKHHITSVLSTLSDAAAATIIVKLSLFESCLQSRFLIASVWFVLQCAVWYELWVVVGVHGVSWRHCLTVRINTTSHQPCFA